MPYLNTYKPPTIHYADYMSGEPYDVNFCLPVPEELSSERVKLVPFVPSLYSTQLLAAVADHPELHRWLPYGPFHPSDPKTLQDWLAERIQSDSAAMLFAIIDRTSPSPPSHPDQGGALAGVTGFLHADARQLRAEIGHVVIFPPFQRTFVGSNATCLLLIHALQVPSSTDYSNGISNVKGGGGGWGLRRVRWVADERNVKSMNAALRLKMRLEGITRWDQTLKPLPSGEAKDGLSVQGRQGDPKPDWPGRHSATFALCWDEFNRDALDKMISRK